MAFSSLTLTNAGKNLLARAQAGETLQYTKTEIGDGALNGRTIEEMTDLVHTIMDLDISGISFEEPGKALIEVQFTNQTVREAFYWREIGVFAKGVDGRQVLYRYANAGEPADFIPDFTENPVEFLFRIVMITGNAENITASIDQSLIYVTKEEFDLNLNQKANLNQDNNFSGKQNITFVSPDTGTEVQTPVLNVNKENSLDDNDIIQAWQANGSTVASLCKDGLHTNGIQCDEISNFSGKPYISANQNNKLSMSWLDDTSSLPGFVPVVAGEKYNCTCYRGGPNDLQFYWSGMTGEELTITDYFFQDLNGSEYSITAGEFNSGPWAYIVTDVNPAFPSEEALPNNSKVVLYKKGSIKWENPANKTATIVVGTTNLSSKIYTENEVDFLCNGTNDQIVINKALGAFNNYGTGGKLILLEGTYNIDAKITFSVLRDVTIEGMGTSTKIVNRTGLNEDNIITFINSNSLAVRNCCFVSSGSTEVVTMIRIGYSGNPSNYCIFENNYFSMANGHAISIENGKYTKINGNTFISTGNYYGSAIYANAAAQSTIIANNTFTYLHTGINIAGTAPGVLISNNSFYETDRCMYLNCINSTITGNVFVGMTTYSINLQANSANNLVVGNNMPGVNMTDSGTGNTKTANKY